MIFAICCDSYPRMSFRVTSIASPWVARTGRLDHRRDIRYDFSRGKEPAVWIVSRLGPVHRRPMSSRRSWATSALSIPICFRGCLFCSWRHRVFGGRLSWYGSSRWIGLHYSEDSTTKRRCGSVEILLTDTPLGEFPRAHAQLETALDGHEVRPPPPTEQVGNCHSNKVPNNNLTICFLCRREFLLCMQNRVK